MRKTLLGFENDSGEFFPTPHDVIQHIKRPGTGNVCELDCTISLIDNSLHSQIYLVLENIYLLNT